VALYTERIPYNTSEGSFSLSDQTLKTEILNLATAPHKDALLSL